jgi:peroxiredoxin
MSLAWIGVAVAVVGCSNGEDSQQASSSDIPTVPSLSAESPAAEPGVTDADRGVAAVEPTPEPEQSSPPTIPEVRLTEQFRDTCLVVVGDRFPAAELVDTSGDPHQVLELLGEKLTVVFFWHVDDSPWARPAALAALGDLENEIVLPHAEHGVRVLGINVQNTAEIAQQCLSEAQATFTMLVDSDGAYFGKVATEKTPRVYLLDQDGKVVWFDIEFSPTTRRQLTQAIEAVLSESNSADDGDEV